MRHLNLPAAFLRCPGWEARCRPCFQVLVDFRWAQDPDSRCLEAWVVYRRACSQIPLQSINSISTIEVRINFWHFPAFSHRDGKLHAESATHGVSRRTRKHVSTGSCISILPKRCLLSLLSLCVNLWRLQSQGQSCERLISLHK